ncbi:MAG: beta-lactamase family protein [Oscillospiraceae bacterium]|nr:beta-lactamase family protein [Oscillospiraceae bacterium]
MTQKYSKAIFFLLAVIMMLPVTACGNNQNAPHNPFSSATLTENARSWSNQEGKYAGLLDTYGEQKCNGVMAVATDDDIVYLYCEDEKEKDGKTPVSQDTVFDIASISKMFTATCILQLSEKGKLSVDDTLDKYFPEYETGKYITIYNLLHMTSGIPDYCNNPDPFWNISGAEAADQKLSDIYLDKITDEEFLEAMYKAPLEFEPGEKVSYSNTNYHLLAFIIEKVSDMRYCDYVRKNIFDPCGMTKTTSMATGDMTYAPVDFDELVQYGFTDKDGYPACPNNCRGDGGIHSCLTDMVAFDRALFGGKLLSEASMIILLNDDDTGYCCGLRKNSQGYSHDGSSFTCSGNNKIIESEEFGHVYVITFVRSDKPKQSDEATDAIQSPLSGTNYTKGVYENGVYVNDYAGIKANIPEGCEQIAEALLSDTSAIVNDCETEKDKLREAATVWDCSFFRAAKDNIHFKFVNTDLAAPENADYAESDYLDDFSEYMGLTDPKTMNAGDRVSVELSGKEYVRQTYSGFDSATGENETHMIYARKLDDHLLSVIWVIVFDETASPEEYEAMFGAYEGLSAAENEDDPMSGTNYTKGVFKDGVYVNTYAGLTLHVPDGFSPLNDSNMEMSRNNTLSDITDDRDKAREKAKAWDIVLIGYEDIIEIDFLNTKLGVPDDADYTAEEYLDDNEDYELRMVPGYMKPQVGQGRSTAELSGKEYLRNLVVLTDSGEKGNSYTYARKLDDDLMCIVDIAIWSEKTAEDYEALFLNDEAASSAT